MIWQWESQNNGWCGRRAPIERGCPFRRLTSNQIGKARSSRSHFSSLGNCERAYCSFTSQKRINCIQLPPFFSPLLVPFLLPFFQLSPSLPSLSCFLPPSYLHNVVRLYAPGLSRWVSSDCSLLADLCYFILPSDRSIVFDSQTS